MPRFHPTPDLADLVFKTTLFDPSPDMVFAQLKIEERRSH